MVRWGRLKTSLDGLTNKMIIPSGPGYTDQPQELVERKSMTKEYKEALEQVEREQKEKQLEELKGYFRATLEAIEEKKEEKARIEEELRVLKLDLEDLKEGKFKKIEERQTIAPVAKRVSVIRFNTSFWPQPHPSQFDWWSDWYGGTWTIRTQTGDKTFYF